MPSSELTLREESPVSELQSDSGVSLFKIDFGAFLLFAAVFAGVERVSLSLLLLILIVLSLCVFFDGSTPVLACELAAADESLKRTHLTRVEDDVEEISLVCGEDWAGLAVVVAGVGGIWFKDISLGGVSCKNQSCEKL